MPYRLRVHLVLIGLGGFAGAVTRYLVDGLISGATGGGFPWGTLAINASGSFPPRPARGTHDRPEPAQSRDRRCRPPGSGKVDFRRQPAPVC